MARLNQPYHSPGKVLKRYTDIAEEVVFMKEDLKRVKVARVEFGRVGIGNEGS